MSLTKTQDGGLPESQRSPSPSIPFLTIFTPTYNRAHTLPDVYRSLLEQTNKNFLWLIVDDGSTDATSTLVSSWQSEGSLKIEYVAQVNSGKHIAYNRALDVSDSVLFQCLDSDDVLKPECVERLKYHWDRLLAENSEAKAICYLLSKTDGGKWNDDFSTDIFEAYFPEKLFDGTIRDDVWIAYDLESIRQFRYPEKWRRIYVPDAMMPFAMSSISKFRFINERLGIYRWNPADEYRLSNFSRPENLRNGGALSLYLGYWIRLNFGRRYLFRHPLRHYRLAVHYNRFADLADISFRERFRAIESRVMRFLIALAVIPGKLMSILTTLKHRRALRVTRFKNQ